MENNKPDWLKAFETDAQEFNDSKYVGYTDGQIAQIVAGSLVDTRLDSELQSKYAKLGASKGGSVAWNNLVKEVGLEEAKRMSAQRLHSTMTHEEMVANTKKASKVSHEKYRKALDLVLDSIIAELPDTKFSKLEVSDIMIKHGKSPMYFSDVYRQRKDSFKIVGKRTQSRGGSTILYQKI